MQMIQYLSASSASNGGNRAVAPVVYQEKLTVATGSGAAAQDLVSVASGECFADAGQVMNKGCYEIELTITYADGADCDDCTVDTIDTVDLVVTVPANSAFPLPPGLVSRIQVVTLDSAGAPIANSSDQVVSWYSTYAPGCNGCVLVP